jgi:UDP-N-acetylglucosamine--N-acetylmuramyl-(pentapeptide) pyrophosphoryl-undecaprenol N-acetylglucosamine transferase
MPKKRIVLAGGGTGGHFYPLFAVAVELQILAARGKRELDIYYVGSAPDDYLAKFEANNIMIRRTVSSRPRKSFDPASIWEWLKFSFAVIQSLWHLFWIMPDAIFSKGGPGALAVVFAAAFYRIPISIHESDSIPGITNLFSGRFSRLIFLAFGEAGEYFPRKKEKLAVGNPIRRYLISEIPDSAAAKKFLGFDPEMPLIFVLGGSQGATRINSAIASGLKDFLEFSQVLHQVGRNNYSVFEKEARETLSFVPEWNREKYVFVDYFNDEIKEALAASDLIVSRAGSAIFEIAAFGKPSILIPLPESAGGHQQKNAEIYAATGAGEILTDADIAEGKLVSRCREILTNEELRREMSEKARDFAKPAAASIIAQKILELADD